MSGKWAGGCLRECVGTFLQPAHWSVLVLILSCSVVSESLQPHGLYPARLLCTWELWSKNIGAGCHFLFQGISLTHGSNPRLLHLPHWRADSLPLSHQGNLFIVIAPKYINKSTPCHLFKLFKKPELSCRFKEWYSQFYIYCFRK